MSSRCGPCYLDMCSLLHLWPDLVAAFAGAVPTCPFCFDHLGELPLGSDLFVPAWGILAAIPAARICLPCSVFLDLVAAVVGVVPSCPFCSDLFCELTLGPDLFVPA